MTGLAGQPSVCGLRWCFRQETYRSPSLFPNPPVSGKRRTTTPARLGKSRDTRYLPGEGGEMMFATMTSHRARWIRRCGFAATIAVLLLDASSLATAATEALPSDLTELS